MSKPVQTVAIDFDGVIHRYSQGWQDGSIYDQPMKDAFDALRALMKKFAVYVFTSRDPKQVADWIDEQSGIPVSSNDSDVVFWNSQDVLLVTNRKLPAFVYVDDRAIRFENWTQTMLELLSLVEEP